ncbi:MAG: flagellar motility protein MotE (MotC chaperone) [Candidatus Latescibacterota bacterium]|jgi:flagellar motility protein MotE (MotC chaperone)
MNTKALFLLLGGMSLSFVVVLGIMLSAVSNNKPRPKSRRVVITEAVKETKPTQKSPAPKRQQTQTSATRRATAAATPTNTPRQQKPTPQSEVVSVTQTAKPPVQTANSVATKLPAAVSPDPKTLREFSTLKKELRREIGTLKKDRDSMLEALAQSLVSLAANEIAAELSPLDNEMAAQTLRHIGKGKREGVLAKMSPTRAKKLRQRLRQLGVK